jgi:hypothetical protein
VNHHIRLTRQFPVRDYISRPFEMLRSIRDGEISGFGATPDNPEPSGQPFQHEGTRITKLIVGVLGAISLFVPLC